MHRHLAAPSCSTIFRHYFRWLQHAQAVLGAWSLQGVPMMDIQEPNMVSYRSVIVSDSTNVTKWAH